MASFNIPIGLLCVVGWLVFRIMRIGNREEGLPPGPPTRPLFGNILTFPKTYAFLKSDAFNMTSSSSELYAFIDLRNGRRNMEKYTLYANLCFTKDLLMSFMF